MRQLLGMIMLVAAVVMVAEPRLHLAFEDGGDPNPHRFALTGEMLGLATGLVISWSERGVPDGLRR